MKKKILYRSYQNTPYGKMVTITTEKGLSALEFIKPDRSALLTKRLDKYFDDYEIEDRPNTVTSKAAEWLEAYFQGDFASLTIPSLDLRGTEFELKVWNALLRIPLGRTVTYHELAAELGIPKGARAVGGANRRNPVSLIIPCHRVIGQNDALVGYGGGLEVKKALLLHEKKA